MNGLIYKGVEFFVLFILLPISFAVQYPIWIKMLLGTMGFVYVAYVLLKVEKLKFKVNPTLRWRSFWKAVFVKLAVIVVLTSCFVWFTNKEMLFQVLFENALLWLFFVFVYSVFSVYPQELVYRTFYFQRYKVLFKNESLFVFLNAVVFALGHLFFKNNLVIVLTFLGGLLFAITFKKTKSTLLVSIEHAIYGSWLFTVGMGSMLGFPV
ncbi:CPBP family intramembrane glutamic endopeptidase [Snuella sedimenti]|uniref:CPBP family intramembrane metalloprotease n=1 Tax=Snuella sedimenti TaxID=2798802 RepID=A0A8J7ISV3_9FLAO|nr:type II CAAX endopeptidase family protein [Snuella sedimenti]MBJ6367310.1 CPBP family intramembrane metalloprotease [Snuella sedimenti]